VRERLAIMRETEDNHIAEEDLRLRGGEILGTRQWAAGFPSPAPSAADLCESPAAKPA
jgi:RecG-like helicase